MDCEEVGSEKGGKNFLGMEERLFKIVFLTFERTYIA